jgi:regulator of RNase E activity RraB
MVDVGVSDSLDQLPAAIAKLRLHYKQPDDSGLPTRDEFDAVCAVEDRIQDFVDDIGDGYVGRITTQGKRIFYVYTRRTEAEWETFLAQLTKDTGYRFDLAFKDDAAHDDYQADLYPTQDDWQVISDMDVIESLKRNGDNQDAQHKIEHFAYFPDAAAARDFIAWAESDRFTHVPEHSGPTDDGRYGVVLYHLGVTSQAQVSSHTIALRRAAEKFGGEYDGWGTTVEKSES